MEYLAPADRAREKDAFRDERVQPGMVAQDTRAYELGHQGLDAQHFRLLHPLFRDQRKEKSLYVALERIVVERLHIAANDAVRAAAAAAQQRLLRQVVRARLLLRCVCACVCVCQYSYFCTSKASKQRSDRAASLATGASSSAPPPRPHASVFALVYQ